MPELSNKDANTWYGGNVPTGSEIQGDAARAQKDPFGFWWDTMVGGKGAAGRSLAASGGTLNPTRTANEAGALGGSLALNNDIRNAGALDAIARAGVAQGARANPYMSAIADQSRGAQLALMQQMRGQMAGPSLAGLQGQRALGQSGQQALQSAAMGAPGRAGMMQAGQVGGGLANDVGQARLSEVMRMQAGLGGAAGSLRGGDLRSAEAQSRAQLSQMQQDEARRQMYARLGLGLQGARDQAAANRAATYYQLLNKRTAQDMDLINNTAQGTASMLSMGMAGGKK